MKPRILLIIETGVAVAAVSALLAVNSLRAATEEVKPSDTDASAARAAVNRTSGNKAEADDSSTAAANDDQSANAASATAQAAETAPAPAPLNPSPGMKEIFELARSGVSEDVLDAYIKKSGKVYSPTVDEIIYLKDLGVAPAAIATLIRTGDQTSATAEKVEAGKFEALKPEEPATNATDLASQPTYAAAPQPIDETAPPAEVSPPSDSQVDLDYFKTSLAAYGSWIYIDGYGACWRPTVAIADSTWRPYFDSGRWIYTNCGWYWLSDYSWGWAPFHYGRWMNSAHWGWVWVPGYSWGPAWVAWRTTPDYCGWAPLPPLYGAGFGVSYSDGYWGVSIGWGFFNWVPYRYCSGYYPRHYAVHREFCHGLYNRSSIIRPTIIGNNNTVIITGPNARVVADASHSEIRRVSIRDIHAGNGGSSRNYLENGGRTLAAFRPTIRPERVRPETELANRRAEFRRPSVVEPASAALASSNSSREESGNRRNIILRGSSSDRATSPSLSAWQNGISRSQSNATPPRRREGQNTTINPRPEYRRPPIESTSIMRDGRTLTDTRPKPPIDPVVGGAIPSSSSRPTRYWSPAIDRSLNSISRQTVTTPHRPQQAPSVADAPRFTPSRQRSYDSGNSRSSQTPNFRSEAIRNYSPPSRSFSIQPGMTIPAARSQSYSSPSFSRPPQRSYSPPASTPSFTRPSPAPSRSFSRPTQSPAPSRSFNAPSRSRGNSVSRGNGRGSRGGAPSRRQN